MATPGPVKFCPSCGGGNIDIAYGEKHDDVIGVVFVSLDTYCGDCGWSGYIEPDDNEWEGGRWQNTWFIDLKR